MVFQVSLPSFSTQFPWEHVIALIPHVVWAAIILGILIWIGRENLLSVLKRVDKVSVAGLELQFVSRLGAASVARGVNLSTGDLGRASRRLANSVDLLRNCRLLWVDDCPDRIVIESKLLEEAGVSITRVKTTEKAIEELDAHNYDVIVSDIRRGGDPVAGLSFAALLTQRQNSPMLVFYVEELRRPTPETAFGITNDPSELVHLLLDMLSRVRG